LTISHSQTPRIIPCGPDEQSGEVRTLLAVADESELNAGNICATLARNPQLFRKWLGFSGKLLTGALSPRARELVILRVAWRCNSDYEWAHHARVGRQFGIDGAVLSRIMHGPDHELWSEDERALLRSVDELHGVSVVGDDTWRSLADVYDESQLIELLMLIGHYHMVAFVSNSLGVQLEDDVKEFSIQRQI
jgi:4-carboxymuconolactone decarboxylase